MNGEGNSSLPEEKLKPSPLEREVLGLMGAGPSPDERLLHTVRDALEDLHRLCRPRHLAARFSFAVCPEGLWLPDAALLLPGQDIIRRLEGCRALLLFAATMGADCDALLRKKSAGDALSALAADAAAARILERYIDGVVDAWAREGLSTVPRYSPGYGDLPLSLQRDLLGRLDAPKRLGLHAAESAMLIPQKSVTAIIGIKESGNEARYV